MDRYLKPSIAEDLEQKMVFISGPRQVGKTTLSKTFLSNEKAYYNWDASEDRKKILNLNFDPSPVWVLDEIHKYRKWRSHVKGIFDKKEMAQKILVTGSAKLDVYRHGGDSLQGRYFFHRLHPLSVAELKIDNAKDCLDLLNLGGFPEPFFKGTERFAKRWTRDYQLRYFLGDLQDLEQVQDLGSIERMLHRLPELVGSPLSVNNLREDIQVAHKTAQKWLDIYERLYAIFRLTPFGSNRIKAVKKEKKHYHFDWTLVKEPGLRFENMLACHLLKWVQFRQDSFGDDLQLTFFRDLRKREVDFVITEQGAAKIAIECKWRNKNVSEHLLYFKNKFPQAQCWQLDMEGNKDLQTAQGIRMCHAVEFLKNFV